MQKAKINLQEVRNFGDSITATFLFIKQEFKSLVRSFVVIMLPLIFVDLFVKSHMIKTMFTFVVAQAKDGILSIFLGYLSSMLVFYWLILFVNSFLRVYADKFRNSSEEGVLVKDVWRVMYRKIGQSFVLGLLFMMAVCVGCVFLVIPGIYVSVILTFSIYFLVIRDRTISESFGESVELVRGQWWHLFGFILVVQLMVGMLCYVFYLPYMGIVLKSVFTHQSPGMYEIAFGMLFVTLGQYFMCIILIVGVGIRFFSSLERKEHTVLLDKIEQLGNGQVEESEKMH